jgi:hypothetical protein
MGGGKAASRNIDLDPSLLAGHLLSSSAGSARYGAIFGTMDGVGCGGQLLYSATRSWPVVGCLGCKEKTGGVGGFSVRPRKPTCSLLHADHHQLMLRHGVLFGVKNRLSRDVKGLIVC